MCPSSTPYWPSSAMIFLRAISSRRVCSETEFSGTGVLLLGHNDRIGIVKAEVSMLNIHEEANKGKSKNVGTIILETTNKVLKTAEERLYFFMLKS
mmetsp:Transcript_25869/g.37054  ORF Transcript_25869/g.37054 Transcript_25869/m.37054 type:complete len:96 (+) Transcript_25869:1680-1967(+)